MNFEKEASDRRKSGLSLDVDPEYTPVVPDEGKEEMKDNTELKESLLTQDKGEKDNVML